MDTITSVESSRAAAVTADRTAQTQRTEDGGDFAAILMDAARRDSARSAVMTAGVGIDSSSGLSGLTDIYGGGMEQMMLSAAASGELTQSQLALFMLYTMTKDDEDSELSRYMPMMIEALAGADAVASAPSSYSGYTGGVLGASLPSVSGGGAVLPTAEWIPTTPALVNTEPERSPEALRAVIDQFNVESAERYRPRRNGSDTYCNIFVWDVTAALGSEIPHYVDPASGAPMSYPNTSGAREQGAIAMENWLETHGRRYGWRETDARTAQEYANSGRPAVTTSSSAGHVQIVCPSQSGEYDPSRGVTVAQAGSRVYNYTYITNIYSQNGLNGVRYFVHE
jgi:hypothetical protein